MNTIIIIIIIITTTTIIIIILNYKSAFPAHFINICGVLEKLHRVRTVKASLSFNLAFINQKLSHLKENKGDVIPKVSSGITDIVT